MGRNLTREGRMIWVVEALSGVTINSSGTSTSAGFRTKNGRICGFFYDLADSTTGTYVSATARLLIAADSRMTYVAPIDSAGAAAGNLLLTINSNDRYVSYRFDDLPSAPWTQLQLVTATANTITFAGAYLVYTDN